MGQRSPRRQSLITLVTALVTVLLFLNLALNRGVSEKTSAESDYYLPCQYSSFSDDTALYAEAIRVAHAEVQRRPSDVVDTPSVGIVSHHLLIRNLIAEYFEKLSKVVQPATIVLIGPNHRARGVTPIAVSALGWKTPFGTVWPGRDLMTGMIRAKLVSVNEDAFFNEHSVASLVPFLRAYFPATRLIPIIVRADADTADILRLSDWLAKNLSSDYLLLGSLDFSHYRTSDRAQHEDSVSMGILRDVQVSRWREAYVDSRKALLLILRYASFRGYNDLEIVQHTNSGILMHSPEARCTSYINCTFRTPG